MGRLGATVAGMDPCSTGDHPKLQQKEKEFIIACGGNLVASKVVPKKKKVKASTQEMTKELLLANLSLEQIAEERGLALTTVIGHLEELVEEKKINPIKELAYMIQGQETTIGKIHSAFSEMGTRPLKPVFEYFDERISYETLRLARLLYEEKETLKR